MEKKNSKKIKMLNNKDLTIEDGFKLFLSQRKAKNVSDETIQYYERCYKSFANYLGKDYLCEDIDSQTIDEYILYLKGTGKLKDITINTHLRGIRAILYYFMNNSYLEKFEITLIRYDKPIKETYTEEELAILLRKPDIKKCSFAEYRNWVIVNFAYGTAARVRTIVNIKIKDIDFYNGEICYSATKGRRQYIVPLSSTLEKIITEYLQYRTGEPDEYLFCNQFGEQMTKDSLKSAIYEYHKKRGIEKTGLHIYRHTFAKNWILNGGDIFRLQKILGHTTLEMVKEYVNMFGHDLKQDFDKFNPLENTPGIIPKESIKIKKKTK